MQSISRVRTADDGSARDMLERLPTGFVVFHDVPLPWPSRSVVDHVVVAPCGLWAVRVERPDHPVTFGDGRGADTLWAGRTPLRIPIESCESDAAALAAALDRAVEPVLCVEGDLPTDSFDFHGLRVCSPASLTAHLATVTSTFEDPTVVSKRIADRFGVTPATTAELPRLGERTQIAASVDSRRNRLRRARIPRRASGSHVDRARVTLVVGVAILLVALNPGWVGLEAADRNAVPPAPTDFIAPSPVRYAVACGADDELTIAWRWPGALPAGVDSYGIRSRRADGTLVDHTADGWRRPIESPAAVVADDIVTIVTEHRDADGTVLASVDRPFVSSGTASC